MRHCKEDCVWKESKKHQDDPSEPCESVSEMEARREKIMPGYKEKLARWLS